MISNHGFASRALFVLAILCTGLLICNLAAMPVHREQVFVQRGRIDSLGETVILIGFLLVPIFNILSLSWIAWRMRSTRKVHERDRGILALGILCLVLMIGEKAMVDEIGREFSLGWEVTGEWIILYGFLAVQLLYNIVIVRRLYRAVRTHRREARAV